MTRMINSRLSAMKPIADEVVTISLEDGKIVTRPVPAPIMAGEPDLRHSTLHQENAIIATRDEPTPRTR